MLAYAEDVLASLRPVMPKLFLRQPRAEVRVRPIPPDRAALDAVQLHGRHGGWVAARPTST